MWEERLVLRKERRGNSVEGRCLGYVVRVRGRGGGGRETGI